MPTLTSRIQGGLLGGLLGDSLALPREGLSPRRARRHFGSDVRHRFLLRWGMMSDDTEHACLTAQALLAARCNDEEQFLHSLAWRLRGWLLGLSAGAGRATLLSILRLWVGISPRHSGLHSAGNGPLMRAPILGVSLAKDEDRRRAFVRASTRLTHTDPRAEAGAQALATIAAALARGDTDSVRLLAMASRSWAATTGTTPRWFATIEQALREGWPAPRLAEDLGWKNGPSGFVEHSLAAALWGLLAGGESFPEVMGRCFELGGDADSIAAAAGALYGIRYGVEQLPADLLAGVLEYPRSVHWIGRLGERLAHHAETPATSEGPLPLSW